MSIRIPSFKCLILSLHLLLLSFAVAPGLYSQGQTSATGQKPVKSAQTIRVRVGLVQTDVEVFDRQGHFVDDLKQDQFELRVDGQPQSISFFELISAGSPHDREIWSKAEGKPVPSTLSAAAGASDAGRTILFFVDDWHMSADSAMRSRTALAKLIDTSMGVHDSAAIFAASGQLGFLQQLTDNKAVLHAALEKLNFLSEGVVDHERPHITEAMAFLVEQNDQGVIGYLANQLPKVPGIDPKKIIRDRAAGVVATAAAIAERSLGALRNLVRSAAALPGRKVIFFLSDGFVLQYHRSDVVSRLMHVTDAAARAGVVIYSLDTRGARGITPGLNASSPDQSQLNIIHRFSTRSHASFLLQIYHAAGPEVQVQTKIYRGNQIAVQPSPKTLKAEEGGGNAEPISYSEELALEGLAPGSYTLEVTVTDRSTNAVARQQVAFQIQ